MMWLLGMLSTMKLELQGIKPEPRGFDRISHTNGIHTGGPHR
jgi:hypothetical protein